jgi:hypothetical protein
MNRERESGVRVAVLVSIALLMTVGVYGVVAGIVKLDDLGLHLVGRQGDGAAAWLSRWLGRGILWFAPWLMKLLSVAGLAAMFLVGGGILAHGVPLIEHWIADRTAAASGLVAAVVPMLTAAVVGILAGAVTVAVVGLVRKAWPGRKPVAGSRAS